MIDNEEGRRKRYMASLRKQFEVVGICDKTDEELREICKKGDWFQERTWTAKQKAEWERYVRKTLGFTVNDVAWWDLMWGWRDEQKG